MEPPVSTYELPPTDVELRIHKALRACGPGWATTQAVADMAGRNQVTTIDCLYALVHHGLAELRDEQNPGKAVRRHWWRAT